LLAIDNTDDDGIAVVGVSKNRESANAESLPSVGEVIMDGLSIVDESANAAESSLCAVEVIVDGVATNKEPANAT
jgi:hypothetical protein